MQVAHLVAKEKGFEVWSVFDDGARVYELFADPDGGRYTEMSSRTLNY
jgi:hypothetical protein